jgi:hypothetical protein
MRIKFKIISLKCIYLTDATFSSGEKKRRDEKKNIEE